MMGLYDYDPEKHERSDQSVCEWTLQRWFPYFQMMGLYDYDPEKQSPGDYTACELAFHAGDILLVYGEERPDGFFHGEVSLNLFWKAGKFEYFKIVLWNQGEFWFSVTNSAIS